MGRLSKRNKSPTTTISISVELRERIHQKKWRKKTCNEFLDKVFSEWLDLKEAFQLEQIAYETASKKNEEYDKTLTELKSIANVQTIAELKSRLYSLSHLPEQTTYVTS